MQQCSSRCLTRFFPLAWPASLACEQYLFAGQDLKRMSHTQAPEFREDAVAQVQRNALADMESNINNDASELPASPENHRDKDDDLEDAAFNCRSGHPF